MNTQQVKLDGVYKFRNFVREAWTEVEPARPLMWGWFHDAICEHLTAAIEGQISHLLIELPPGCTKSLITGTFLPAYVWVFAPWYRWLTGGHNERLALGEASRSRRLVESPWYRTEFGVSWRLRDEQNQKGNYETTVGGSRITRGMRGAPIGLKGHCVLLDDPNDVKQVQSAAQRAHVNEEFDAGWYDRVLDFIHGTRIIIAHRTHENDLIGHCKAKGGWECLTIPEEWSERRRRRTCIGWTDPRKIEGQLLRPRMYGPKQAENDRRRNLMLYQAKHLQEPRSAEGIRFKARWFKKYTRAGDWITLDDNRGTYRFSPLIDMPDNNLRELFQTADGAASASNEADFTVVSTWAITQRYDLVWLGCRREKLEIPDQPEMLMREYRKWSPQWIGIEVALANRALFQISQRMPIISKKFETAGRDKLARATPAIVLTESGRVYLPDQSTADAYDFPLQDVMDELTSFTGNEKIDEHDDIVDTFAYAATELGTEDAPSEDGTSPIGFIGPAGWAEWLNKK